MANCFVLFFFPLYMNPFHSKNQKASYMVVLALSVIYEWHSGSWGGKMSNLNFLHVWMLDSKGNSTN